MTRLIRVATLLLVGLGLARAGHAQTARAIEAAKGYTGPNNLPERRIVTGPASRPVTRIVVPVLATTYDQFIEHFSKQNGGVVFHGIPDHQGHIAMMRQTGDLLFWARQRADHAQFVPLYGAFTSGGSQGHLIAAQLEAGELAHLNGWLDARTRDGLYAGGNCMEWLSNAEVGPGKPIFHALGLTRSRDGNNIRKKLLRAANDKIGIIGVKVGSVAEFNAMTDDQLLGPVPAGGLDDSTK
jgi:hypothetical protein